MRKVCVCLMIHWNTITETIILKTMIQFKTLATYGVYKMKTIWSEEYSLQSNTNTEYISKFSHDWRHQPFHLIKARLQIKLWNPMWEFANFAIK